jgi:3-oxoacyl-[acyl-carrier protein] reductase
MQGKVAVVTGGARDIGRAISIRLAGAGAKVVINYFHSPEKAEETLRSITEEGGEAILVKGDMTRQADVEGLYRQTVANFGTVDILVNNAGGLVARKSLEEMTEAFFDEVVGLNFRSVFLVSKTFMPAMKAGDCVVNISSQAARDGGGTGSALYGASKAAVSTFTRAMAREFGPKGVRVNAVCPGLIDTLFHDTFTPDEVRTRVSRATPLRREGAPVEVADLVCFLASDQASFITGANYDINGGLVFS